jgi:hypothetical protein
MQVGAVAALVLSDVQPARAAFSLKMPVVALSNNVVGRLAALRQKDVARPKLSEQPISETRPSAMYL